MPPKLTYISLWWLDKQMKMIWHQYPRIGTLRAPLTDGACEEEMLIVFGPI
jgi:hypothetical protein